MGCVMSMFIYFSRYSYGAPASRVGRARSVTDVKFVFCYVMVTLLNKVGYKMSDGIKAEYKAYLYDILNKITGRECYIAVKT
jgi:hypothetical protein